MADGIAIGQPIINNAVGEDYSTLPNIDAKYGPYSSVQEALSSIQVGGRAIGLTIGIKSGNDIKEYWFKRGTADANLVIKQTDVDLSNYDTSTQVDTKIKKAVENIEVGGDNSPYTRAHMRKLHVKISGLPANDFTIQDIDFKYGAENIISFTCDDANTSALSVIWAGINKRPVSIHSADIDNNTGKTYQYHANQYLAGDIPNDIIHKNEADGTSYPTRFCYLTPFGNELIKPGVAIWPYATNHDGNFMDRTITVDKTATNLYRFMVPYLVWEDCNLLKRYGFDFYFHNIGTERYGASSDVYNVIQGLNGDMARAKEMLGRTMKIIARPDGNNTYMDAMMEMPKIDMAVAENSPAKVCIPYYETEWFHKVWQRIFSDDIDGVIMPKLTEMIEAPIESKEWVHYCCHTADKKWADLLYDIGAAVDDPTIKIWFTTVGELYEYVYYKKHNRVLNTKFANGVLEFDYEFSYKENFDYKEMTLAFASATQTTIDLKALSLEIKDVNDSTYVCPIQQLAVYEGKVWLLLGVEESIIDNIEYFVSKYEETEDTVWKDDAELQLRKIDKARRDAFQARINAISPSIPITSLSMPTTPLVSNNTSPAYVDVTFLPENATNYNKIVGTTTQGYGVFKVESVTGNIIRFKIESTYSGVNSSAGGLSFKVDGTDIKSNTVTINFSFVPVPIVTITSNTTLLQLSNKVAKEFTVTCNPSNNTEMSKVSVSSDSNIEIAVKSTTNNIVTYTVTGKKDIVGAYSGNINISIAGYTTAEELVIPYELIVSETEPTVYELIGSVPNTIEVDKAYAISISTKPSLNIRDTIRIVAKNSDTVIGNITYSTNNDKAMCGIAHKTVGKDKLTISCNIPNINAIVKEVNVIAKPNPTVETFKFCCAAYKYSENNSVLSINDATYGGTVNYEEFNNSNHYFSNGSAIKAVDGSNISVTRNTVVPPVLVQDLGAGAHTYTGAKGASNANGDCSSLFTCNPEYKYFYVYNQTLGGGCAFNVPNGKYRVRLLSSTKEASDAYNNGGKVFINKVNITSQLPTVPYRENNVWTSWIETTVSDGILSIIVLTDKSKRVGLNAFEVEKIE